MTIEARGVDNPCRSGEVVNTIVLGERRFGSPAKVSRPCETRSLFDGFVFTGSFFVPFRTQERMTMKYLIKQFLFKLVSKYLFGNKPRYFRTKKRKGLKYPIAKRLFD